MVITVKYPRTTHRYLNKIVTILYIDVDLQVLSQSMHDNIDSIYAADGVDWGDQFQGKYIKTSLVRMINGYILVSRVIVCFMAPMK